MAMIGIRHILGGTSTPIRSSAVRQLIAHVNDRCRTPPAHIVTLLVEDRSAVIEGVERLRKRERILREHRELQRADHLLDDFVQPRGIEHERPELVAAVVAVELAGRDVAQGLEQRGFVETIALLQLLKDVVRADDRVLDVGAAFALEAERLLEIERDHLAARELDHEVAHGGNRDHPRDALALVRRRAPDCACRLRGLPSVMSVSSRSSALTPSPLRPDTSTNGRFASSESGGGA